MRHSETLSSIAPALVAALAEIEGAAKKANNGHFKTKYADLSAVIEASKETLAKHGLALMQFPGAMQGNAMSLETVFLHTSGEWLTGAEAFGIVLGKADPQGVGSALTYARRYAQMSAMNMPAVDDDAETAVGRGSNSTRSASVREEPNPSAADFAIKGLKAAASADDFKATWEANRANWKAVMSDEDYARVVAVMQGEAKRWVAKADAA